MLNKAKQLVRNERGFTLVEILIVIAIIAILFVTLLPQIDNAVNRSRETGVKTDFHTMQSNMENYMRESGGQNLEAEKFNKYLDPGMYIIANSHASLADGLDSTKEDVWGTKYDLYLYPDQKAMVFKSFGPDEKPNTDDDFTLATYYYQGQVISCTDGFDSNNVTNTIISGKDCGKKAPGNVELLTSAAMKTVKNP